MGGVTKEDSVQGFQKEEERRRHNLTELGLDSTNGDFSYGFELGPWRISKCNSATGNGKHMDRSTPHHLGAKRCRLRASSLPENWGLQALEDPADPGLLA